MNRDNLIRLIDHLERTPDPAFKMLGWIENEGSFDPYALIMHVGRAKALIENQEKADPKSHPCGTVACIGGYAAILSASEGKVASGGGGWRVESLGCEWLGLSDTDSMRLFYGEGYRYGMGSITKKRAIAVLKHFLDTGKINWNITINPKKGKAT